MSDLRPFFGFYGGKWRTAPHYPYPRHSIIVEPFAGSAGYSVRYADHEVWLFDVDPYIAGVWRYLISASPDEMMGLPDLQPGQSVDDLKVPQEARWLIGFWINFAPASPRKRFSAGATRNRQYWSQFKGSPRPLVWGPRVRERLARQVTKIRHWKIFEADYRTAQNPPATWFIDPPYQGAAGKHYRHLIDDYPSLGYWCRKRFGQVIVCEGAGATWLPFQPFGAHKSNPQRSSRAYSQEVIWVEPWSASYPIGAQEDDWKPRETGGGDERK